MKIIPDTSVIIDGRVTERIRAGEYLESEIIIAEAVLGELEAQANKGQEIGMSGLEEIRELKKLDDDGKVKLIFKGERPTLDQIKLSPGGEIDHLVRELASKEKGTLLTSDLVQAQIASAKGIKVEYLRKVKKKVEELKILDFFGEDVMSVHLRENIKPKVKAGTPGDIELRTLDRDVQTEEELRTIAREIIETSKRSPDGFIEMDKGGATIVQLEDMRIVIARPPFSDGFEITAVRPVAEVTIDDYELSKELKERLTQKQRGILLAGAPGAGKSTLAKAIGEFLNDQDYIVKTMEEPRDLMVSDDITQYTSLEGDIADTADVLLLVRPDYTIYDEVRKTPHFKVFADTRMAGVGMIGVTHANRAIDALQRMIGRVDLGMVPQVVDTIIFLEEAEIRKVYEIKYTVKVPVGMTEEDLARPVIQVIDYQSGVSEYEIYTYGEQIVVMPVDESQARKDTVRRYGEKRIEEEIERYVRGPVEVQALSDNSIKVFVPQDQIPAILGTGGKRISSIEKELDLNIDVRSYDEKVERKVDKAKAKPVNVYHDRDKIVIEAGDHRSGDKVDVLGDSEYLLTATVGGDGTIKIREGTEAADKLLDAIDKRKGIRIA